MNGVRFNYLYRDWGNYKDFGVKDFTNPNNWSPEVAEVPGGEETIDDFIEKLKPD